MSRGATRGGTAGLLLALSLTSVGCDEGRQAAAAAGVARGPGLEREATLGAFLTRHWTLPVPPQGEPPASYTEAERSLDPVMCGSCHPKEYAEWGTSLHAQAFSPGFAGQLIEGELARPLDVRSCQSCHAPLAEQQPFAPTLDPNPDHDPELRAKGLLCAGCHVRRHRYYGPPRRPEAPEVAEPIPHAGFDVRLEYLESRFCAECHQFFDDAGINGKPVQNTFVEWQQSPQAAEGRQCQDCHMPDRAHLWRGIHDRETVRAAVDIELVPGDLGGEVLQASLVVFNREVGHAFPTYVAPRVFLAVVQLDIEGVEIPGTRVEGTIGREVDLAAGRELFDTRVLPRQSVRLDYRVRRARRGVALVAWVTVDPDCHYRGMFEALLPTLRDTRARTLIEWASRRISASEYLLAEIRRPLPVAAAR